MKNSKKFLIKDILIFLFLAIIIVVLQFTISDEALKFGFRTDDRIIYFGYKILGSNPLSKIAEVWNERGLHTTYQVYYLGLLEKLVGFDYRLFHVINVLFKALATLTVFPLILVIFKNKILALLTTILYATSYASIGPLEYVIKGSDYTAIFWMCIFLTVYSLILRNNSKNIPQLILCLILLILTLSFSPIRLYPLLILLPLVELFLLINNPKLTSLKNLLIRMFVLYSPFILLTIFSPNLTLGYLQTRFGIYHKIFEGNWHLALSPFAGVGYAFTTDYWGKIFGLVRLESLSEYLFFLLGGPAVIFGVLTVILALLYSKRPRSFFLFVFISNFVLEILVFFMANNFKYLPKEYTILYDSSTIYAAFLGIYVMVAGVAFFTEWLKDGKRNNLLLALWTGSLFLFVFVFATWSLEPSGINFSSTSYYLVVASIGSSLVVSTLLLTFYYRIIHIKKWLWKAVLLCPLFLMVILFFSINIQEINSRLSYFLKNGRSAEGQKLLQQRFKQKIKDIDFKNPTLFYFDTSEISTDRSFYEEGFLSGFAYWMFFEGNIVDDGCTEALYFADYNQLIKFVKEVNGQKGLFYRSLCVSGGRSSFRDTFYELKDFHAFIIKNKDFYDIKQRIVDELGLKY